MPRQTSPRQPSWVLGSPGEAFAYDPQIYDRFQAPPLTGYPDFMGGNFGNRLIEANRIPLDYKNPAARNIVEPPPLESPQPRSYLDPQSELMKAAGTGYVAKKAYTALTAPAKTTVNGVTGTVKPGTVYGSSATVQPGTVVASSEPVFTAVPLGFEHAQGVGWGLSTGGAAGTTEAATTAAGGAEAATVAGAEAGGAEAATGAAAAGVDWAAAAATLGIIKAIEFPLRALLDHPEKASSWGKSLKQTLSFGFAS